MSPMLKTGLSAIVLLFLGTIFTSCKTTKNKTAIAKAPVENSPKMTPPAPLVPLPTLPIHHGLNNVQQKPTFDPVDEVIQQSESRFHQGERSLQAGFLEKAKRDFDASLEVILRSGIFIAHNERLERHYEALIDRIHSYELAALKEGDGFSEERYDAAPIDEIAAGEVPLTFDPKSKLLAEQTINEIPHDIPLPLNETVLRFLDYFQNQARKAMEAGMQRSGRYRHMISKILAEEGVPQDLIYLCQAESGFKPLAYSKAKCKGLWQFAAPRGSEYGLKQNWWIDERSDPEKSTRAAARHLKDLYNQFGDWLLAMAAYNTGPGNIERAIERTGYADYWELLRRGNLHPETQNYVPIILAMTIISKDSAKYGFDVTLDPPLELDRVKVDSPVELRLVAESLDISLSEVRELNPHVRRMATPRNDPDFTLYLPKGASEKFLQEIAAIPEHLRVTWRLHRVDEGESLTQLARKYRTTSFAIGQANNLSADQKLQIGSKLIIPVTPGKSGRIMAKTGGSRIRYTVGRGDTIASIARDYDVSAAQIRKWNKLGINTRARPGRVLILHIPSQKVEAPISEPIGSTTASASTQNGQKPDRVIHRVKKGDTLYALATNYGTSIDSICDWNNLSQTESLRVGDKLTIYVNR